MTRNRGVTLIELMIALAITMIMMGAVVTLFANLTTSLSDSRSVIEITERLRRARDQLQLDLAGHTAPLMPPLDPGANLGYLEIVDGPNTDVYGTVIPTNSAATTITYNTLPPHSGDSNVATLWSTALTTNNIMGDCDDVLALTVRSSGVPFVGRGIHLRLAADSADDGIQDGGSHLVCASQRPHDPRSSGHGRGHHDDPGAAQFAIHPVVHSVSARIARRAAIQLVSGGSRVECFLREL